MIAFGLGIIIGLCVGSWLTWVTMRVYIEMLEDEHD
jgi:prepilin signal peptidase PulO-like enzyme (type II secretory pathway)